MQEIWIQSLGQEDTLEKGMVTHSSILAWRIPWTKEPGRLQSTGSRAQPKRLSTQHIKDSRGYIADNQGEEGMDGLRV